MKRTLIAAAGLALLAAAGLAGAASWSVVVQPGIYGRVAIGGYVEAPLVYSTQPVMVVDDGYGNWVEQYVDPYATPQTPVYLWVPEYQRIHWARYCHEYGAFGVPVYFVDDGWYRNNVMRRNWTAAQRGWNHAQWIEADRSARDRFERQRFERQRYVQPAREQPRWNNERAWHDRNRGDRQREPGRWEQARWDHDRPQRDQQDRMRSGSDRSHLPQLQAPRQPQQPVQQPRPQAGNGWQPPSQGQGHGGPLARWQQGNGASAGQGQAAARDGRGHQARGQADGRGQYERGRDGNRDR